MERPKRSRPSSAEAVAIFPEQLRIGDRFTNADGEWEVASRPVTFKQGHEVRAKMQRPGDPGTTHETTWPAFERVKVRRTFDMSDRRSLLVAAPGFVLLGNWRSMRELVILHAWLDTWSGLGAIVV